MMRHIQLDFKWLALFLFIILGLPNTMIGSDQKFHKKYYISQIKEHIKALKPLPEAKANKLAESIYQSSTAHQVPYKIMTAIIMVESGFSQSAVSSTGDISIAQINYKVWKKEAKRLHMELSESRLKKDSNYAILKLGEILKHLKKTYSKNDKFWYARYHSRTPELKKKYLTKLLTKGQKRVIASQNSK